MTLTHITPPCTRSIIQIFLIEYRIEDIWVVNKTYNNTYNLVTLDCFFPVVALQKTLKITE